MSEAPPHVGRILAAARVAAGWTQKELAERMDLSPSRVSRWESGLEPVGLHHAAQAAQALGLHRDELAQLVEVFERAHERRSGKKSDPASWRLVGHPGSLPRTKEEARDRAAELLDEAMVILAAAAKQDARTE